MAYKPDGSGDLDTLRRNAASCHSAVAGITGDTWLSCVRAGWSVRRVRILPADQPVEELDRPGEPLSLRYTPEELVAPEPPVVTHAKARRKVTPRTPEKLDAVAPFDSPSWIIRCGAL
jgi:hypothetical protein